MKTTLGFLLSLAALTAFWQNNADKTTLVIHGGAGTTTHANMGTESEKAYREVLQRALETGYKD